MTEEQDREISLEALARKFAGGNKESRGGWLRTLREAAKAGTLQVRTVSVPAPGVVKVGNPIASRDRLDRDFQTVGETTFAGMSARVVAPRSRQAITQALARTVHQYVAPAAVAAWLASLPEHATKDIHSQGWAWLGDAWPVAAAPADSVKAASRPSPANGYPPVEGTIPPVASGCLAIKAAWHIECEEARPATDGEVMARLREWGKTGAEPNHLLDCDKLPTGTRPSVVSAVKGGAIPWQTGKSKVNAFTLEACQKALEKWRKSRQ